MASGNTVLFVGGHETGKSNYLIRFWLAIRDKEDGMLRPNGLPDDLEYLNAGADALLGGNFFGRTNEPIAAMCEIPLLVSGDPSTLLLPDFKGEKWVQIYKDRRWPSDWSQLITKETTFLVFVRALFDQNVPQLDWQTLEQFYGAGSNLDPSIPKPKMSEEPPTQVVLVDWIQTLLGLYRSVGGPAVKPKIGIVVTAWDRLSDSEQAAGPSVYLRQEFRLLSDFLQSNRERFETKNFGVSIVGGDLRDDLEYRDKFLDSINGHAAGYVWHELQGRPEKSSNLALPVAWALSRAGNKLA
ncbi:hypothetical protein FV242_31230 [Methylobacterium sp. WL64]|uniref:TRAFAC clade GTPase domain-containing protein n=1 Tax=Methylobacterium sp. WL64 TaxID=2603894 RepID=UPI0011CA45A2|nr:hypothetical protein [Methylobacterium sp. WL64]TXM97560.1 hypothetical protein FV242_31230 [Methylobacterium sp. WL64]